MKKIKIGIPRALLYHRYGILWKKYFELIGCKIIISPETNNELLKLGISNSSKECCLPYKIYLGHAIYLSRSCDYILIPRICNYGKKAKTCPVIDNIYNNMLNIIPKKQIIKYDIEHTKYKYEFIEFIKIGLKFTKNIFKIIYSYLIAKQKQKEYDTNKHNEERNKLNKNNKKILILSHFYNINDKYISNNIINCLKENNIIPIYSNNLDKKTANIFSAYFSNELNLIYIKEMLGALYYYKYMIDGIIFINTSNCYINDLINKLIIYKNKEIPILNITIDESNKELLLKTKLKTFIDNF